MNYHNVVWFDFAVLVTISVLLPVLLDCGGNNPGCYPCCEGRQCGEDPCCEESCGSCTDCQECVDGDCKEPDFGIEWIEIPGGSFQMGSDSGEANEAPVHGVDIEPFEMTKTEVTVAEYQHCIDQTLCSEAGTGGFCNSQVTGRDDHPVNCVDFYQASRFCECAGGMLPSEAEWEYAARSGGRDIDYPWGDQTPSCSYAVMFESDAGCGTGSTWSVCSKTEGNTKQGLCDMAGNVWEWVQDWYHADYSSAPTDGSAWEEPAGYTRVIRGGSLYHQAYQLRATYRNSARPDTVDAAFGFRCLRRAH